MDSFPVVRKVHEVWSFEDQNAMDHVGSFVLIAPDPMSGRRNRYSVIRIDYQTGKTLCIGREIPLDEARKLAKRCQNPAHKCFSPKRK